MNRIERLFFRYNMELFILGFAFFIALVLFVFDPSYNQKIKASYLVLGIPLLMIIVHNAKTNRLPVKKGIYINLLWIPISLFADIIITMIFLSDSDINIGERNHIVSTIIMVAILLIVLMNVIDYQRYINANKEMDKVKTMRCFLTDNIELFILFLVYCSALYSYVADKSFDNIYIRILVFIFIAMPIICIDTLNSLHVTKVICIYYSYLITPIVLCLVIHKYITIHNTGIRNYTFCVLAGLALIANIIIYRNYLYLKYKNEWLNR